MRSRNNHNNSRRGRHQFVIPSTMYLLGITKQPVYAFSPAYEVSTSRSSLSNDDGSFRTTHTNRRNNNHKHRQSVLANNMNLLSRNPHSSSKQNVATSFAQLQASPLFSMQQPSSSNGTKTTTTTTALLVSNAAAETETQADNSRQPSLKSIAMAVWFVSLSSFIICNYKIQPWIPFDLHLRWSKPVWVLLHAVSNMFFTGGIVLSTILEWMVVRRAVHNNNNNKGDNNNNNNHNHEGMMLQYWMTEIVPKVDTCVVLPALTCTIVAGFAQTALDYGSMATAPKHIRRAIHILLTFCLWWMITDLPTQAKVHAALYQLGDNNTTTPSLPKRLLWWRRISNLVSCGFVMALYGLMTLKPGMS